MNPQQDLFDPLAREVLAVAPGRAHDLARLRVLARTQAAPTITVVGKYNHGKSRLLNELMGRDVFAVADRRETVTLSEHHHAELRWLDAPGLDADVALQDDSHAQEATWLQADVRLFVHAAKEGELDAAETHLLQALRQDQQRTRRQTLFVLTQVDQMSDDEQLAKVSAAIQTQAPGLRLHPVSSTRHRSGVEGGKSLLLQRSGIPALQALLREVVEQVPAAREHERGLLFTEIGQQLQHQQAAVEATLLALRQRQQQQRHDFEQGLQAVLKKVHQDLLPIVELQGDDPALLPDSASDEFRLTAGKRERARIHVAYSRACIAIRAHLIQHGVEGLPASQRTSVASLDTVMVAVLGVSIKYRADLRRQFCEPAGQAQLMASFLHYYELSEDRQALQQQILRSEAERHAHERALRALARLREGAGA
ncbi:50S ribosome-binding GTPase [Herbaspirillum sp. DW155]|uniref:GTPase n=1 Tax=Herbaspirillum sp. DW155 TaxID=3095609 RepID=UPI003090A088|nr:50S ribosome-binding GTPase [Herbaspirillum sp. DW155]